jgi:hypothetical protein
LEVLGVGGTKIVACSTNKEKRNAYWILTGKPEGKRPLGITKCWWEDNIKIDLREIIFGDMDLIDVAQDRDHKMLGHF